MTAREFYITINKGTLPSQVHWSADGAMRFADAFAAEQRRGLERERDEARRLNTEWAANCGRREDQILELIKERDDARAKLELLNDFYASNEDGLIDERLAEAVPRMLTAESSLREREEQIAKQVTELIKIAADVAHRRYLPDLEKARTIRHARETVARYDGYHMTLVDRIKRVADDLRTLAALRKE